MGSNPSHFKGADLPVDSVSWDDVQKFIKKLNEMEALISIVCPLKLNGSMRAVPEQHTRYYFGDDESKLGDYAWYSGYATSEEWNRMIKLKEGKLILLVRRSPIPGVFTICTVMSGNGFRTVSMYNYEGAPSDGSAWEDGDSQTVCCGAVAGYYSLGAAGQRIRSQDRARQSSATCRFRLLRKL